MATLEDLRARLETIAPGRFTVEASVQKARYTAPETVIQQLRPFASTNAVVTVTQEPLDFAVIIDEAMLALVAATNTTLAIAALRTAGCALDLRLRPVQAGGGGATRVTSTEGEEDIT